MLKLYDFGLLWYGHLIRLLASTGHYRAQKWVQGRKDVWKQIEQVPRDKPVLWFHAASAGEFEQGRPLIEACRAAYPNHFVLLSFFSPSGYEQRKNYRGVDLVCYLPEDKPRLVATWLDRLQPKMAIFIKYEFWHHHFEGLRNRRIPLLLVSTTFRPSQPFFKPITREFWCNILDAVRMFYVQDQASALLLNEAGYVNVAVCGDTRIDQVLTLRQAPFHESVMEAFTRQPTLIVGSSWPADEKLLHAWWKLRKRGNGGGQVDYRLLIAPHEPSEKAVRALQQRFGPASVRYSKCSVEEARTAEVLILDMVGMLSKVYRYGRLAYVGGGFGKSIHNILEPAAYGLPLFFGPNHQKFHEAKALLSIQAARSVKTAAEMNLFIVDFDEKPDYYEQNKQALNEWFEDHAGATQRILQDIKIILHAVSKS